MVLLSRSLNFFRTYASLILSRFFEFGKILPHPGGIRPSFFAPGQRIGQKILPGWPGLARSKNFARGCPGGCTQLELTETLFSNGFGHVWISQGVGDEELFLKAMVLRMTDIA